MKIYVVSDTHFYHQNILKYHRYHYRDIVDMNEDIVERWNRIIPKGAKVLHLGDVFWTKNRTNEEMKAIIDSLHGEKMLMLGNHDQNPNREFYYKLGFTNVEHEIEVLNTCKLMFSHVPIETVPKGHINIHGHIHGGTTFDLYEQDPQRINVCWEAGRILEITFKRGKAKIKEHRIWGK